MGKIWLKSTDPNKQCCGCEGKSGPCGSCCFPYTGTPEIDLYTSGPLKDKVIKYAFTGGRCDIEYCASYADGNWFFRGFFENQTYFYFGIPFLSGGQGPVFSTPAVGTIVSQSGAKLTFASANPDAIANAATFNWLSKTITTEELNTPPFFGREISPNIKRSATFEIKLNLNSGEYVRIGATMQEPTTAHENWFEYVGNGPDSLVARHHGYRQGACAFAFFSGDTKSYLSGTHEITDSYDFDIMSAETGGNYRNFDTYNIEYFSGRNTQFDINEVEHPGECYGLFNTDQYIALNQVGPNRDHIIYPDDIPAQDYQVVYWSRAQHSQMNPAYTRDNTNGIPLAYVVGISLYQEMVWSDLWGGSSQFLRQCNFLPEPPFRMEPPAGIGNIATNKFRIRNLKKSRRISDDPVERFVYEPVRSMCATFQGCQGSTIELFDVNNHPINITGRLRSYTIFDPA